MIPSAGGELVERLFERLLIAVGDDDGPLTIGDLYQRLIPYRSIRSEVGVMELAAYEHALLRLLGGEGGRLAVDLESAAAEIRRELASPNPILGIYRDYAEVPVRIVSRRTGAAAAVDPVAAPPASPTSPAANLGSAAAPDEVLVVASIEVPRSASKAGQPASRELRAMSGASPLADAPPTAATLACSRCQTPLPAVDGARFCPFCGQMREPIPCDNCGTPVQPAWNFCIRCGSPARP